MKEYAIGSGLLTYDLIEQILNEKVKLTLSEEAKQKIEHCRSYLDAKMDVIWQFIVQARRSHSQAEADHKILQRKIRRSMAEAEGVEYNIDKHYRGNRGQDWGR